ncbi:hypothetical protein C8J56DRAFT_1051214 [Mycena floridula]|nr:hypothetical protein C8J56DRAFT_1051214 [Mycena floridula]
MMTALIILDSPPKEPIPSSEPPNTSSGPLDESDSKDNEHEGENPYFWDFSPTAGIPINNTTQLPTQFEEICAAQIATGLLPWAPFQSKDKWDMVRWMMKSGLSQAKIDEFSKLKLRRDPLECIKELMGNPAFKDHLCYAPEQQFLDKEMTNQVYSDSWTADWCWQIQQRLPEGATVAPIILSSNKTQLSRFRGDKQAWPVYLSLSNIPKDIRRKPSEWLCCHVYTIVMAYIADWPEQVLIAGCKNTHCPCCLVLPGERGNTTKSDPCTQEDTLDVLYRAAAGLQPDELDTHGIKLIDPFWADLPHCDIFSSFTPDLLHRLHKDTEDKRKAEVDERFKRLLSHPHVRHFNKAISWVSQWTGNEFKHMEKVFVGVSAGTITNKCVILVVKSALDFIYYSHFEFHMTISLQHLHTAWEQSPRFNAIFSKGKVM